MNKEKKIISIFLVCAGIFLLTSCSNIESTQTTNIEFAKQSEIAQKSKDNNSKRQETLDYIIELLNNGEQWAKDGRSTGKVIEDLWKENKEDEVVSALYYYNSAMFYLDAYEGAKAKEEARSCLRKISPDYQGLYFDEINALGLKIFGNKEEWIKEHEIGLEVLTREKARENGDLSFEIIVFQYIEERYDYYDKKEGKSTGDKYSEVIFNEAAKEFDITIQEVNSIWMDIDVITKVGQLRAVSNSTQQESIPSNAISLQYEDATILCGTTQENYSELIDCLVKKDEYGWNQMLSTGKAFVVPSRTRAIVLEKKFTVAKVRIVEGIYKDEIAWVAIEAIN
ncbi:MAG TPA: hypothetical protein PLW11_11705 [Bacillota bacterium]|nr:hypothetical protein [Bacillota bacterium]